MTGGQSYQMVLLPCVSSGPVRLVCADGRWRLSCRPARAPPDSHDHQDLTRGLPAALLKPGKTLGQRLAPASPASKPSSIRSNNEKRSQGMIQATSVHDRCKGSVDRFTSGIIPVSSAALALREGEADP
jgi:hypothetical protein